MKWFPDRRGLITGVAVGGFGAGALVTAPVATRLIETVGVLPTFAYLGAAFLIVTVAGGVFMRNPPEGWRPAGWAPTASEAAERAAQDYTLSEALGTRQWWALWLILFLNTSAGISIISQEAPLFPGLASAGLLTVIAFVILMCYGGGFGTMPALTADYFGSNNVGPIYGLMLTAWGFASVFGPLLIAHMRQASGSYRGALHVIAGVMLVSIALPLIMSPPRRAGTRDRILVPGRTDQRAA